MFSQLIWCSERKSRSESDNSFGVLIQVSGDISFLVCLSMYHYAILLGAGTCTVLVNVVSYACNLCTARKL